MRVVWALAALALLAGCDNAAPKGAAAKDKSEFATAADAEAFASTGTGFDYRYAYRLPGNRLKGVLQSNADGCERLGPARCRILSMRYRVDDRNHTKAVLTIRIDPAIARKYGDAVTNNVTGSDGVLVDTEITGSDATTQARSTAVVNRLRERLSNAESIRTPEGVARVARINAALAEIAESEASQGQTLATAPLLLTYESSNALTGLGSSDANFRNAGQTLQNTLAQLVVILAGVGPWLLLMLLVVLVLRWIIHGRAVGPDAEPASAYHDSNGDYHSAPPPPAHDKRTLMQRWFDRGHDD
ncbi:MAG: hypothetical protein KF730_06930 [Sphingomonas sp.]|uniref:hypothetical protein n=1 Tax=Sphingomonas sp. TaxID=28214 RepID=UPI0025FEAA02|nr:hypothetical protein [Sphingomonas sp.]MBX3564294.1 hypothetical protein [Sphingomonas sp.]